MAEERVKPIWARLGYVRDRTCPGSRARVARELLCSMGRYATTASGVLRARVAEPSDESARASLRYGGALSPAVMTAAAETVARDPWRKGCL
jgi:hypothetical protein